MENLKLSDSDEKMTYSPSKALYRQLQGALYSQYPYKKCDLGERMWLIEQVIDEYWKPRYLMDDDSKTAVEFMNGGTILQTVSTDDIDWESLQELPEYAIERARRLNATYPTFVRKYKDGVATVSWELNPDGRYYMDSDGFGMTDDEEITIYGCIDRSGKTLVKFRTVKASSEVGEMEEEAKRILKART